MVVLVHCKFGILLSDPYIETHETIAKSRGAVLVKNTLRGILANPSRMSDRIHPNDDGYALFATRVSEKLVPLLSAAEAEAR